MNQDDFNEAERESKLRMQVIYEGSKKPNLEIERLREENERLHVENRRLIDRIETMGVPIGVGGFATTTSAQPEQDGKCKRCTDGCPACDARKLPEQEPVAWVSTTELLVMRGNALGGAKDWRINLGLVKQDGDVGLYTTPPQRKPLTDEEIATIAKEHIAVGTRSFEEFARRIEAAHGIKGEA